MTAYENMPFLGQDMSQHLTGLPYSTLRVRCYFHLAIKIILLQLKILTFLTFLLDLHSFLGTPPHADVIASFWAHTSENS